MTRHERRNRRRVAIGLQRLAGGKLLSTLVLGSSFGNPDDHQVTVTVGRVVVAPTSGDPGLREAMIAIL